MYAPPKTNGNIQPTGNSPSPNPEDHPGPPQASSESAEAEASASARHKVASQIRAFQTLADECDVDWDQGVWDEIHQLMELDEIFENSQTDDHGEIMMDVDILLEDLARLCDLKPEEQVWTKTQIREFMTVLKERGRATFYQRYVLELLIPIPKLLLAFNISICPELSTLSHRSLTYFLQLAMHRALSARDKLPQYNTVRDAVELIKKSQRILILTGAGISVSCGIPDFRSRNGLYSSLSEYELDDPQQMFDITYFREKPSVFYSFASKIYPSNFVPSPCHRFIKLVEDKGKLLRNYTQNIDTLETLTGVQKVIQCHGSFATASCIVCQRNVPGKDIEADIMRHSIPLCTVCHPPNASTKKKMKKKSKKKAKGQWDSDCSDESDGPEFPSGIMKPDITFFGEKLSDVFDKSLALDREQVDLLLVIGTSLKVSPVADLISHIPHSIPQILINKTPIRHINPDIVLLGNADTIIQHLCSELEWEIPPPPTSTPARTQAMPLETMLIQPVEVNLKKRPSNGPLDTEPVRVRNSHVWLFDGAEGGKWLKAFEQELDSYAENDGYTPPQAGTSSTSDEDDKRNAKRAKIEQR